MRQQVKRHVLSAILSGLALAGVATTVEADPIHVGDHLDFDDSYGTTGGGEFLVTVNDDWSFITFCLQKTEYINYDDLFEVGGINTYAMTDSTVRGGHPVTGHDELSFQTAWLYTQFRAGTLAGYNYVPGAGRVASANELQRAIWWFENEELNPANVLGNIFVAAANNAVANGWNTLGNVRAMNLYRLKDGSEAQDQLVLVDPDLPDVPEPASLTLVGLGSAVAAWRRRRAKANA